MFYLNQPSRSLSCIFLVFFLFISMVSGAEKFIGGGGDNFFSNPTNWDGGTLPQAGDDIDIEADCVFDQAGAVAYKKLKIKNGATLSWANATYTLNIKDLDDHGSGGVLDMSNAGTLIIRGEWKASIDDLDFIAGSGTVDFQGTGNNTEIPFEYQSNLAFGWGNHADAGYLTNETDPLFTASPSGGITNSDISTWNASQGDVAAETARAIAAETAIQADVDNNEASGNAANTAQTATLQSYTDQAETDAKTHSDNADATQTTALEAYADQAEADANTHSDNADTAQTTTLHAYVDQAETDAKTHSDNADTAQTTDLENYADQAETDAIAAANTHSDNADTAQTTALHAYADQAETDAKTHSDNADATQTTALEAYADQVETDAKTHSDNADTAQTTALENYADQAETDANTHSDNADATQSTALQAYADQAETDAVSSANTHSDNADTAQNTAIINNATNITNHITADGDLSATNEIQDLSVAGNTLSLTNDATTVDLSGYLDNTDTQLTETQVDGYVSNNGYLTSYSETDPQVGSSVTNKVPHWNGSALVDGLIIDNGTRVTINGLTVGKGGGNQEYNSAIGNGALFSNTTGNANTAIGFDALQFNSTGSANTAIGQRALRYNTTGHSNTAIGLRALNVNTFGANNTAIGFLTLGSNTTGNNNTANGRRALASNTTGSQNTANGQGALVINTTGSNNTANGRMALFANTTGHDNTATGAESLRLNTTGHSNTADGYKALLTNITGVQNTALGNTADVASDGLSNATAIGHGSIVDASNKVQIGNTAVTNVSTSGTYTAGAVTYPNTDGTSGQVLTTNGAGAPTWQTTSFPAETDPLFGASTAASITGSDISNWNNDAVDDADASATNELQDLSLAGNILSLTDDATTVDLSNLVGGTIQGTDGNTLNIRANDEGSFAGNTRGENSVDLQTLRNNVVQVASGIRSSIGGGSYNRASGSYSSVGGGLSNNATSTYATVGGGRGNNASNSNSSVGGGFVNKASGPYSTVGGGRENISSLSWSTTGGGYYNKATANAATVSGGSHNNASSSYSTIGGGYSNSASGSYSSVAGGRDLSAESFGETVVGIFNVPSAGNPNSIVSTDPVFVVGNGTAIGAESNALTVLKNGATRINGTLTIDGDNAGAGQAFTFPAQDGTAGQVMQTDGVGNASWQTTVDSDTQLTEAEVDSYVANNGYLSTVTINDLSDASAMSNNLFIGQDSGSNNSGGENTAIGLNTLNQNTSGSTNIAIGRYALEQNTTGSWNTVSGYGALRENTTGSDNTAMGFSAGEGWDIVPNNGSKNTFVGAYTNASSDFTNATALGYYAVVNASNKVQIGNWGITSVQLGTGSNVTLETGLIKLTGGSPAAGKVLTSDAAGNATWQAVSSPAETDPEVGANQLDTAPKWNGTALVAGSISMRGTQATGLYSSAIGINSIASGHRSNAIGNSAKARGEASFAVGQGSDASGSYSIAIGLNTIANKQGTTSMGWITKATGLYSTALGYGGQAIGEGSTAMGTYTKASGDYSTALGLYPIASGYASTAMGRNTLASGSQSTAMGNNIEAANNSELHNSGNVRGISFISTSDARYKKDVKDLTNGLDKVLQLQGVTYQYKDEFERFEAEKGKDQIGFIAQDVQKVLPELVSDDGTDDAYLGIRYAQMSAVLVEAVKEQQEQINERDDRIAELEDKMDVLIQQMELILKTQAEQETMLNDSDRPSIEQNAPNPFGDMTSIKYYLPQSSKQAELRIYDINNRLIKIIEIENKGHGAIDIRTGTLNSGTYIYEFIVDGEQIDTKKMVFAKY